MPCATYSTMVRLPLGLRCAVIYGCLAADRKDPRSLYRARRRSLNALRAARWCRAESERGASFSESE
jgi:hypothetical protein